MRLRTTSSAIGTGSMAALSRADCAPWASGTSLPHQPRLGRTALPNGSSDRSRASVWTTSLSLARTICAEFCDPMPAITTASEQIDHWIKMRRSLARFSGPGASHRPRSSAVSITTTPVFSFRHAHQRRVQGQDNCTTTFSARSGGTMPDHKQWPALDATVKN